MQFSTAIVLICCFIQYDMLQAVKIGVSKTTIASSTEKTESVKSTATNSSPLTIQTTTATPPIVFKLTNFPPKKLKSTITTTTSAAITTTSSSINAINLTDPMSQTIISAANPNQNFFCSCDLLINSCDINCCCDADCSHEALKVFNCLAETEQNSEDFRYQLGLTSCKINDGWLCVFRTNIRLENDNKLVGKLTQANFDFSNSFKWTNPQLNDDDGNQQDGKTYYKVHEPLKLINPTTMEVKNFVLPYSYRAPYCHIHEPIGYLKTFKSNCLQTRIEKLQETQGELLEKLGQFKLLNSPSQFENDYIDPSKLLEFKLRKCNVSQCNYLQLNELNNTDIAYENTYVDSINVKIYHNYTNPIGVLLVLNDLEFPNPESVAIWQQYEVEFIYLNKTQLDAADVNNIKKIAPQRVSGPLGYLQGAPLIVAKFVQQNENSDGRVVLSYFHDTINYKHTINTFVKQKGICLPKHEPSQSINYGINTFKQCKVRFEHNFSNAKMQNFTAICLQLQQLINYQLLGHDEDDAMQFEDMSELFISTLGKPQNATDKWLQLNLKLSYDEYRPIVGELNANDQSYICRNMLIDASYEFHIGLLTLNNVPHQSVLTYAALDMGKYHDLEFQLDETIQVPVSVAIMFYDYDSVAADVGNAAGSFYLNYISIYINLSVLVVVFVV